MARIELHKAIEALDYAHCSTSRTQFFLDRVFDCDVENGNFDADGIRAAKKEIDFAISKLQKAKQILTKE